MQTPRWWSMDKVRKLRRYNRKDYSQLVDFPVEIVGRDGVVRRYSFEESVRLYQRRIASADLRYDDGDVVLAEVKHCSQRIDQLRRSYFARYGWSAIQVVDSPGVVAAGLAGEVAAFLRRSLEGPEFEPEEIEFAFLHEDGDHQIYFVRNPPREDSTGPTTTHLLYLFRFSPTGSCPSRESFFEFLRVLQGVNAGGDSVETLQAFHHTADCGLVLTGPPGSQGVTPQGDEDEVIQFAWFDDDDRQNDPLHEGMVALRRGDRQRALDQFVAAYEQNHYRRAAYVGAAVVADQLGARAEAETATLMGTRYFPNDPLLHYQLAVSHLRSGAMGPAREALERVRALAGTSSALEALDALLDLRMGALRRGRLRLRALRDTPTARDADLDRALVLVRAQLTARTLMILTCVVMIWTGVLLGLAISAWAFLLAAAGLALVPATHAAWRRQFERLLAAPGAKGLRLANPAELRATVALGEDPQ